MNTTRRARKAHNKVRTGCSTCKARRKKCDEAKPSCRRCDAGGFKCDGYTDSTKAQLGIVNASGRSELVSAPTEFSLSLLAQNVSSNPECDIPWCGLVMSNSARYMSYVVGPTEKPDEVEVIFRKPLIADTKMSAADRQQAEEFEMFVPARTTPTIVRSPSALTGQLLVSDLESHCYSYFQYNTVPRFTTYFENCFWRVDLQHAAHLGVHHLALFKAVVALGAVHRRFCYGISREAFEYCIHAARLYKEATSALHLLKKSIHHDDRFTQLHVITACEELLALFQAFQGNADVSSAHIRAAVRSTLSIPLRLLHSESWHYTKPSPPRIISGMMYQLYCCATELYGEPVICHSSDNEIESARLVMPEVFDSLRQMKDCLFQIVEHAWRHHRSTEDLVQRRTTLELYQDILHAWTAACLKTLDHLVIETSQAKSFNLLSLTRCALSISIQGHMLTTDRHRIRPLSRLPVLVNNNDTNDFSEAVTELNRALDYMYAMEDHDLWYVRSLFQQTLVKHNLFRFDGSPQVDSRINEMLNLWTIAKQMSELEESEVVEALRDALPPGAEYVDVADMWRDGRKVMLRYFERNQGGEGCRWVQQYWSF